MKKISLFVLLLSLCAFSMVFGHSLNVSIVNSIPYNGSYGLGATYVNGNLWVADFIDKNLYQVNVDNGKIEQIIIVNTDLGLNGLTWDSINEVLIVSENGPEAQIRKIDLEGNEISSFPTPGGDSTDLAYATHFLYNGDFSDGGLIHKILVSDGSLIKTMPAPGGTPQGLTYVDGVLWNTDTNNNQIYMLDSNCNIIAQGEIPSEIASIGGMAHDGQYFWVTSDDGNIYQLQVNIDFDTNNPDAILILTGGSNTYTLSPGTLTTVYGNSDSNNIVLKKNTGAMLHSFQGENTITIESEYDLFSISRSGATVTFQGNDGTLLVIPATTTPQTIIFNDQWFELVIDADSGRILLGDQEILPVGTTYQIADYFPMAGSWETDQRTLFMGIKDRELNGVVVKELMDTSSPKALYWTCDENGLRNHGGYDPGIDRDVEDEIYIESTPIIFAEASVKIGDKNVTTLVDDEGTEYVSVELEGVEEIKVPAGTFSDCLRFRATFWTEGQNEGDNGYETIWLARNVGFAKSVNEIGESMFFSPANETRQLLSYYAPGELTDDQIAIQTVMTRFVDAKEGEDLTGVMALLSENYAMNCLDKAVKQAQEQNWFDSVIYNRFCAGIEDIVVSGDHAYAMVEYYVRATVKADGSGWQSAMRESFNFVREDGSWYFYGTQMSFHPYGDTGYFAVYTRNQEWKSDVPVMTGFHDCATGNLLASPQEIETFTLTGPAPFYSESIDLMGIWDEESTEFWDSGLLSYDDMSSGFYTFTVTDTSGNFYSYSDYVDKQPLLDVPVHISPVDDGYLPPGDNTFSWGVVSGVDVTYEIHLSKEVNGSWQQTSIDVDDSTSHTLSLEAGTNYRWRVRAMQADRLNGLDVRDNESRSSWDYFTVSTTANSKPLVFSNAHLHYRVYENGTDQFRGWCTFQRGDGIAYSSDITSLVLKDESDMEVATQSVGLDIDERGGYSGTYDSETKQVIYSGPFPYSGFNVKFPDGTDLAAGEYTYEAQTGEGETLTFNVSFPGQTILPLVSSSSMTHIWEADGSLTLSWTNPEGTFDQIRVSLLDHEWRDVLCFSLPNNMETVTIPTSVINDITATHNPSQIIWQVSTRAYSGSLNYARGYSDELEFTWEALE